MQTSESSLYSLSTTAYLLFFVAFVFAENVMVNEVLAEAGTNMSIGCPGVTMNTFVVQLEWKCIGQCGLEKRPLMSSANDANAGVKLLKYVKDQQTTVANNANPRIRLDQDMFALEFDPVRANDRGRYLCLINNRPLPDAIIHLNVLGE